MDEETSVRLMTHERRLKRLESLQSTATVIYLPNDGYSVTRRIYVGGAGQALKISFFADSGSSTSLLFTVNSSSMTVSTGTGILLFRLKKGENTFNVTIQAPLLSGFAILERINVK